MYTFVFINASNLQYILKQQIIDKRESNQISVCSNSIHKTDESLKIKPVDDHSLIYS